MKTFIGRLAVLALLSGGLGLPVLAAGPVDGELGAVWWASDFDSGGGTFAMSSDSDAPGYRAELWFLNRYGVRASLFSSNLDDLGLQSSDSTSLDLMWRAFAPSENSFIAIGAGWQEMDLAGVGLAGDTSGVRLAVEGRIGLPGPLYVYGLGAYMPELDDAPATDPLLGRFEDLEGRELDLGLSWTVAPFVALRAGYRVQRIDFMQTGFTPLPDGDSELDGEIESAGYLVGLSFRF